MKEDLAMACKVDDDQEKLNIEETLKCDENHAVKEEEVNEMREENLRLKTLLQQIESDYKSLQKKLIDAFKQESSKSGGKIPTRNPTAEEIDHEDQELVSLRLGTSSNEAKKEEFLHVRGSSKSGGSIDQDDRSAKADLATSKEEERWSPGKAVKTQRSNGDDEVSQTSVKRARVCVRARCDTPTMNDGCQWRKYGQKIAKGNPCPRAYYRCTVSPTCPVRKQVQRFVDDMSILITTYEGTHNHPLPLSATAMASTTSAAASMLLSGSSSSTSQPSPAAAPPLINLYGQPTFHPSNYFISNSSSNSSPTITLDLITNPPPSTTAFTLYSSPPTNPRFPATNLSFSSMDSTMAPPAWGGAAQPLLLGRTDQQQKYNEPHVANLNQSSSQQDLTETLTKVISSDPSFRSAIAAVFSKMAANGGARKIDGGEINLVSSSQWREQVPAADPACNFK